ncbi:hypothetical protein [Thiocapsa marina]|uniref:Uncharacterized protein n=1 Tax=Thiocapsa marina 5811 TaxID=768671 RepID=F9U937_9GAMM|nr:hypothetical protein [Thiocapsa marina]EGV19295.1 hypothetical protein ThimaDRAFT_1439 [Thiocapsa marina 5811]
MTIKRCADHGFLPGMVALCLAAAVSSAHAQSFNLDNGVIRAVTGIEIQGSLYDVTFADGAFNGVYPARLSGYGPLAQEVARALLVASESGALTANVGEQRSLPLLGCSSRESCTVLIPEHSTGAAPSAQTTYAVEVIYSRGGFRSVTSELWPFDASTDTLYMPDMLYAIITPAG